MEGVLSYACGSGVVVSLPQGHFTNLKCSCLLAVTLFSQLNTPSVYFKLSLLGLAFI